TADAARDFSNSRNTDDSVWSYRYKADAVRDGNYPLLAEFDPTFSVSPGLTWVPENPGFWGNPGSFTPWLGVNETGADVSAVEEGVIFPSGSMMAHPPSGGLAVLSWRSPSDAEVRIDFSFTDADAGGGNGIRWFVERNAGADTLASGEVHN